VAALVGGSLAAKERLLADDGNKQPSFPTQGIPPFGIDAPLPDTLLDPDFKGHRGEGRRNFERDRSDLFSRLGEG
jgi:hypothetical protein